MERPTEKSNLKNAQNSFPMKKSLILVLVFALGVFGAMQPTYAQKKKKKDYYEKCFST
jgi:hypothetical protein